MLPIYVDAVNNYIEYNKKELGLLSKTFLTKEDKLRKAKLASALHLASRLQASNSKEFFTASIVESLFIDEQEKIKKIRGEHASGVYDELLSVIVEHIGNCKIAESHLNNILTIQPDNVHLHRLLVSIFTYMCNLKFDEYISGIRKLPSQDKWSKEEAGCIRDAVKKIINTLSSKIDNYFIDGSQILRIIEKLEKLKTIKNKDFKDKMEELSSDIIKWPSSGNGYSPFYWRSGSASESDFELDDISGIFNSTPLYSAPLLGMFDKSKIDKKLILTDRPRQQPLEFSPLRKKSRWDIDTGQVNLSSSPDFRL